MPILPDTVERYCASNFPPEASQADQRNARTLYHTVRYVNCDRPGGPRLHDIVYRSSTVHNDIRHHVFCFNLRNYQDIFQNGLRASPQGNTPDEDYFDLVDHVERASCPLASHRTIPRGFVSTTLSPSLAGRLTDNVGTLVYRYEIYAPGGIFIGPTLGDRCNSFCQREVAFVAGIAPQYIRAAQLFVVAGYNNLGYVRLERADPVDPSVVFNMNFQLPEPGPGKVLRIENPTNYYMNKENKSQREPLKTICHGGRNSWRATTVSLSANFTVFQRWYMSDVSNCDTYINAAFRSSRRNEAYVFMGNEYILLNYAPGTTNDRVVNGPLLICDGYPSLANTPFGEYGIDCAFGSHYGNEAFIFYDNLCAQVNYAPGTRNDWIIKGPMTIALMFPFFRGTVFETGIDAAFESSRKSEAYLFRGSYYALISYSSNPRLIAIRVISKSFPSLRNTIFHDGIEAAFASHRYNEAYIFKGRFYALINFAPCTTNDYIIGGVKEIFPSWPSLRSILPRKNHGLDVHAHS